MHQVTVQVYKQLNEFSPFTDLPLYYIEVKVHDLQNSAGSVSVLPPLNRFGDEDWTFPNTRWPHQDKAPMIWKASLFDGKPDCNDFASIDDLGLKHNIELLYSGDGPCFAPAFPEEARCYVTSL
tara:strand:+ start:1265 stop:1636 length:372 start_codon:yes stop_codon:yes gene_type:complete